MKKLGIVVLFILALLMIVNNSYVNKYVALLTESAILAVNPTDPLYQSIVKNASTYEIPPSDAKIDRVWKAIPGYNGLKVDIEASYKNMKKLTVLMKKTGFYTNETGSAS